MHQLSQRNQLAVLCIPVLCLSFATVDAEIRRTAPALQDLVNSVKGQLGVDAAVEVAIVPANTLLVSVQPVDGVPVVFRMAFDERFLVGLDEDDLKAIVAHELGHVWIFTHHPYLQTERLANTVAMRAVPRASLERVYSKVWERAGTKGDLARFLGPQ